MQALSFYVLSTALLGLFSSTESLSVREEEVRRRLEDFIATYESGDGEGTTAFYHPQAIMMPMGEQAAVGRDEIRELNEKTFEVSQQQNLNYRILEVKQIGPKVAFTRAEADPEDSNGQVVGLFQDMILWKKHHGEWYVYREINTLRA